MTRTTKGGHNIVKRIDNILFRWIVYKFLLEYSDIVFLLKIPIIRRFWGIIAEKQGRWKWRKHLAVPSANPLSRGRSAAAHKMRNVWTKPYSFFYISHSLSFSRLNSGSSGFQVAALLNVNNMVRFQNPKLNSERRGLNKNLDGPLCTGKLLFWLLVSIRSRTISLQNISGAFGICFARTTAHQTVQNGVKTPRRRKK